MSVNKFLGLGLAVVMALGIVGCGNSGKEVKASDSGKIVVISREEGSGTRGAFIELFGIEKKDANGKKVDHTTENAGITNSTAVMMTTVAGNKDAIGYISLGSLNDNVKAVKIDGVEASITNIKSGVYKIARPFNIVTAGSIKPEAQDFINYILSKEGQTIVFKSGYIGNEKAEAFRSRNVAGKVVVAGSSSVSPVMEKLAEAYKNINSRVKVEVQQNDSSTGVKAALDGLCDIGMASRDLKKSELDKGARNIVIATDGIAVIVNKNNKVNTMSKVQVADVFMGNTTQWEKLR
ncbi:MAG: extracellular solute-binding protein [Phascolarctobacterium sp.]|nr:extracellular solute-binding protein [Phascolarctobacterium sp.]